MYVINLGLCSSTVWFPRLILVWWSTVQWIHNRLVDFTQLGSICWPGVKQTRETQTSIGVIWKGETKNNRIGETAAERDQEPIGSAKTKMEGSKWGCESRGWTPRPLSQTLMINEAHGWNLYRLLGFIYIFWSWVWTLSWVLWTSCSC